MFQFPAFPFRTYLFSSEYTALRRMCSHIRIPPDRCLFTAPRSFSQLIASFFGSWCQGIHLTLFLAWTSFKQSLVLFGSLLCNCLSFATFLLLWFSRKFLLSKRLASFTTLVLNCNEYFFSTLLFFLVWKDQFLSFKLLLSNICSFSCSYSVFNDHFFVGTMPSVSACAYYAPLLPIALY